MTGGTQSNRECRVDGLGRLAATDRFAPGFQKVRLWALPEFRAVMLVYIANAVVLSTLFKIFAASPAKREAAELCSDLVVLVPLAARAAGGFPREARWWYAGFCAFCLCAFVPPLLGGPDKTLLGIVPAAIYAYVTLKKSPGLLRAMGFQDGHDAKVETPVAVCAAALMAFITYYVVTGAQKSGGVAIPREQLASALANGLIEYGVYFGLCYGLLMRKLVTMRFELFVPIVLGGLMLLMSWIPAVFVSPHDIGKILGGQVAAAALVSFTMGMCFYFRPSARMLFASYYLFYVFYKCVLMVR